MPSMDVVIPVAVKDIPKLLPCVRQLFQHSRTPIRNVYVVARSAPEFVSSLSRDVGKQLIGVEEREFPFTKEGVEAILVEKGCPYGSGSWYYQQLLKLYAFRAVPELLPHALILDSDFFLMDDLAFIDEGGRGLLAYGYPFTWLMGQREYPAEVRHVHADFAARLVPGWHPTSPFSGMQHHMLFQRDLLEEMLALVEERHGAELWRAFMDCVMVEKWNAASEYVLYHHHVRGRHPDKIVLRHLDACDVIYDEQDDCFSWARAQELRGRRGASRAVGFHGFRELRRRLETMDYIPPGLRKSMLAEDRMAFMLRLVGGMLDVEAFEHRPESG